MQQDEQVGKQAKGAQGQSADQIARRFPLWVWAALCVTGAIVVALVILGSVIVGLLVLSRYLGSSTDPISFITGNLLNALIFAAILIQAVIYLVQWQAMRASLRQGRQALQISERAYVGIHSIEQLPLPHDETMILKIENIGRLPAREITVRVDVIMLTHDGVPVSGDWWNNFQRTNLFKGNLKLEIPIPIAESFTPTQLERVFAGNARLIAQIRIEYWDGFKDTKRRRSDYAFRFQEGKWRSWPVWTVEGIEERHAEEQDRYPE